MSFGFSSSRAQQAASAGNSGSLPLDPAPDSEPGEIPGLEGKQGNEDLVDFTPLLGSEPEEDSGLDFRDVDASAHADLLDCQLPVVRGCTDLHFGGHAKQLLHPCLSTDLILGTGRLPGDVPAPLSYPHAAGGSRPDHLALDLEVAAVVQTSKVDASRLESDHFPLCMTLQCSRASQPVPVPDADGTLLPRLNWDDSRREAYVQVLDGCALNACAMLAAQGSIPQACEQLSATVLAAAQTSGCRFKPAVPAGPPRTQKRREHKPFFDRECRDLKRLYQHTRSRDPEQAHVLLRKYASVVRRKCRIYRQTDTLLREIRSRPRDFCKKLNGKPAALPRALQQQSKWQQYMADLCAPASSVPPPPSTSAPTGAQQLASGLNDAVTSGEVQAALPLLNNGRSCAKSGWPAELLRYAYREVTMEDGKVSKLYGLAPILAALLDSAFQSGTLPDTVKSSLITPVFKKGDKF